ncbi:MAG: Omp28-related outer membrane protein [Ignavibacteriota bacterium]
MKKLTISIIGLFLASVMFYSCESNDNPVTQNKNNSAAKSKVLMEFFTAVNCPNCPPPGHFLDLIDSLRGISINDTNVVIIRYHSNYNGYDPFYLFNPAGSAARHNYYGYQWNPAGTLMGVNLPNYDQNVWLNNINVVLAKKNPLEVGVSNTYDTTSRAGTVNISLKLASAITDSDLKLFVMFTENELAYAGTNGERVHQNTYRQILTDNNGDAVTLQPGVIENVSKPYTLKAGIIPANSRVVVFVQSQNGKTVYGVESVIF